MLTSRSKKTFDSSDEAVHEAGLSLLGSDQSSEVMLLSAPDAQTLARQVKDLIPLAERICRAELTDLGAALAKNPHIGSVRMAIVAKSPWELADSLNTTFLKLSHTANIAELNDPTGGVFAGRALEDPSWVALFPGQGSQRLDMGKHWLRRFPFVRDLYARADEELQDLIPGRLSRSIFCDSSAADELSTIKEAALQETQIAQPAITLSSMATVQVLDFLGLKPSISIGHSLGEIAALGAARAYDERTAVRIAAIRGQAMASLNLQDPGAMVAVAAGPEEVQELIDAFAPRLVISNYNSPTQTVVSGTSGAAQRLLELCDDNGIHARRLPVSHAFHSWIVAPAATAFRTALDAVRFRQVAGTVISTSVAQEVPEEANLSVLLGEHIQRPVRFTEAVLEAARREPALWVEVGPSGVLTNLVRDIIRPAHIECLPTDLRDEDGFHLLNIVLARAFVLGFPLALERFFAYRFHRSFDVERYNPALITNPCERTVEVPEISPELAKRTLRPTLLPEGADDSHFAQYLEKREPFLRDFVNLDYQHYLLQDAQSGAPKPAGIASNAVAPAALVPERLTPDPDVTRASGLDLIAECTGFPQSSITPELRLRDDLNLDSIKVQQLVMNLNRGAAQEVFPDPAALVNARVGDLISAFEAAQDKPSEETPRSARDLPVHHELRHSMTDWVRSFSVEPIAAPLDAETVAALPDYGKGIIIAEPRNSRFESLAKQLEEHGLASMVITPEALPEDGSAPSDLSFLVIMLSGEDKRWFECTPTEFDDRVEGLASHLFRVFKWVARSNKVPWKDLRCLVLRPVAEDDDHAIDLDAGGSFLQSLRREHPGVKLKWISLPETWTATQWGATIAAELRSTGNRVVFGYTRNGKRNTLVARPSTQAPVSSLRLSDGDVVLVSGGAKGITFELAFALARETNVKLALLGSSARPENTVESQANEIVRNLERLRQEQVQYRYVQCDVTDLAAVTTAVAQIEQELGRVTGILHGAGISQPQRFVDSALASYLHCIRVKSRGLYNLLTVVPPTQLKALHVLSSVLGRTGMPGQADYTFANAWLDGAVNSIATSYSHLHCVSLGYSVWSETGLGKKLGAADSLASMGITTISTADGVAAYLDVLRRATPGGPVVVTGRLTPDLESDLFEPWGTPRGRFLERVLRHVPRTELVCDATLSHKTDPYLAEHVFEGTPIFPGVMAIEAMVEAAVRCAEREDLPILRNVRFHRPIIVPSDRPMVMRTLCFAEETVDGSTRVHVAIRSEADHFRQNHFEAECIFSNSTDLAQLPICPEVSERLATDPDDFSPTPLFQGKFFRRIIGIRSMTIGETALTDIAVPTEVRYYGDGLKKELFTPSPVARDSFLQSGALILPPGCLPQSIDELRFIEPLSEGAEVLCHVQVTWCEDDSFVQDFAVFTTDGRPVETMYGVRVRRPKTGPRSTPGAARSGRAPTQPLKGKQALNRKPESSGTSRGADATTTIESGGFRHRFVLSFKHNSTPTDNIPVSAVAKWMGEFREIVLQPIQSELLRDFRSGFGAVTNRSSVAIFGRAQTMDTIEGRQRVAYRSRQDRVSIVMSFDWLKGASGDRFERFARSEVDVSWVRSTGYGKAELADIPGYFADFLSSSSSLAYLEPTPETSTGLFGVGGQTGELLYRTPDGPRVNLPFLISKEFETSPEHANLIGNVYYTNYYVWAAHAREQWLHQMMPDYHISSTAELYAIDATLEHLQEAMPFDTVSVSMYLLGLYENQIRLYFEFHSCSPNREPRKLAYSEQTAVWIVRDRTSTADVVETTSLPSSVIEQTLMLTKG